MSFDLSRVRSVTPLLENRVHLLASGVSPMPNPGSQCDQKPS